MRSSESGTGRESDDGRAVVTRLSRPHVSGGTVTERAAIVAEGAADWIMAHAGQAEAAVAGASIAPPRVRRPRVGSA